MENDLDTLQGDTEALHRTAEIIGFVIGSMEPKPVEGDLERACAYIEESGAIDMWLAMIGS